VGKPIVFRVKIPVDKNIQVRQAGEQKQTGYPTGLILILKCNKRYRKNLVKIVCYNMYHSPGTLWRDACFLNRLKSVVTIYPVPPELGAKPQAWFILQG